MSWKLATAPATEPISLTEAKLHLKMDDITTDDTLITSLIKAARMYCEQYCNAGFVTQTWEYYLDRFPRVIELNKFPISAISIKYYDKDNVEQTLASTVYSVDMIDSPTRITLGENQTWPEIEGKLNAIKITATVGFGAAADVPDDIKAAILLMVGNLYANRESNVVGRMVTELPFGVKALLDNRRSFVW